MVLSRDERLRQRKEYREKNKEKIRAQKKKYRESYKDKIRVTKKKYYTDNKEKISERNKRHYNYKKDEIKTRGKKYRDKNRNEILERKKKFYYKNRDEILLQQKEYYDKNKQEILANTRKKDPTRIRFKGRIIDVGFNPYIGVCNWCRAVVKFDCKKTAMHHDDDRYDDLDPLRYTIELCPKCHRKETIRLAKLKLLISINSKNIV